MLQFLRTTKNYYHIFYQTSEVVTNGVNTELDNLLPVYKNYRIFAFYLISCGTKRILIHKAEIWNINFNLASFFFSVSQSCQQRFSYEWNDSREKWVDLVRAKVRITRNSPQAQWIITKHCSFRDVIVNGIEIHRSGIQLIFQWFSIWNGNWFWHFTVPFSDNTHEMHLRKPVPSYKHSLSFNLELFL